MKQKLVITGISLAGFLCGLASAPFFTLFPLVQ